MISSKIDRDYVFHKKIDILLAAILLLLTTGFSVQQYRNLSQLVGDDVALLGGIPEGSHRYELRASEQCVGFFRSDVSERKLLNISSTGELRLLLDGDPVRATVALEAFFNPLKQLVASGVTLRTPEFFFYARAEEINPIQLEIYTTIRGVNNYFKSKVRGPVLVQHRSDVKEYRIALPSISDPTGGYAGNMITSLSDTLALSIVQVGEIAESCSEDSGAAVDLQPLIGIARESVVVGVLYWIP